MPPYHYAFGDETGNLGFAFERGSTPYFALLLLLLDEPEPLRARIDCLKEQFGIPLRVEFKFNRTSNVNRRAFLSAVKPYPFVGRAIVVDKRQLPAMWQKMRDVRLYAFCFAELVRRIPSGELGETILTLDHFGSPKTTLPELRRRLKTLPFDRAKRPFKKISLKRSQGENLIQCADMIAGALMRSLSRNDNSFFSQVADKVTVWRYPGNENPPG
ncbi:MAG: DUF3800 domain-containing protein [Anaerolineales bacterium]